MSGGPSSAGALKRLSRAEVIALAVTIALAGFYVAIPAGKSPASNWKFALTHPSIFLHIAAAVIVLVIAAIALVKAVAAGDRFWISLAGAGFIFVLIAFAGGVDYTTTLQKGALDYMSAGWVGAIISYGIGWYQGRKKARQATRPA
jgi:hypothetical protein